MKRPDWSNVLAVLAALYIGATCSAESQQVPDTALARLRFVGLEPIVPSQYMRGLWWDTQVCLQDYTVPMDSVRFGVADAIIDMAGPELLWGVYARVYWPEGPALTLVVDRLVRHSARVWSHEMIHAAGNRLDGEWQFRPCTLEEDSPYALPERELTAERVRELLERR